MSIWATMMDRQRRALDRVRVLVSGRSSTEAPTARGVVRVRADLTAADVYVYDAIDCLGVNAADFTQALAGITAPTINLHVNSPGGDVFDGMAIYNALKNHPARVVTYVDGVAASIASIIALAGDEVVMGEGAYFMIHDPWGTAMGNAADMRQTADLLDKVGGQLAGIYARQTGMSLADVQAAMAAETWYTGQEAVDAGFATSVAVPPEEDAQAARQALARFDLSIFGHAPETLRAIADATISTPAAKTPPASIREVEQILRDAGCSHAMAKSIATAGWKAPADPRDEDAGLSDLLDSLQRAKDSLSR